MKKRSTTVKPQYDLESVRRFCRQRGIARLEIFGSALRNDFRSDSDVDLLCTLTPEKDQHCGLLEWVDMQFGLEKIFGRPVDLVSRWAIERSRNRYRRNAILSTATPIYVKR
ncbi:MAG TPA: nucleotidyltransferase domain-containing protein [Verrucomicrobiae bacterium]|jgi:hypothetical protein